MILLVSSIACQLSDYEAMLRLEPGNKQAKVDLADVEKVSGFFMVQTFSFTDIIYIWYFLRMHHASNC